MKYKLSDICSFRKGKVEVENLNTKNYISTENMLPNKCGIIEASSLPSVALAQEYKNGDILVSNIRPYFKKIWKAKYDGGCSNDVLVFVAKSNTDRNFLYYVLADDDFFTYSMTTSKGTKMPRGDKTSIMQYEVPMIDLQTQKKIASILKSFDEKIELNNVINNNLEQQAQAYFDKLFVVNADPNWPECTLSDIGSVIAGGTPSKSKPEYYADQGIAWITPKDLSVDKSKFISRGENDISELGFSKSSATKMPAGTILFSSRAPIGYIAIAQNEVTTNQGFKSVIPNENIGTAYVYFLLKNLLPTIEGMASGSTFKEISGAAMRSVPTVIPDADTIQLFSNLCEPIFKEQEVLESENKYLSALRDTLLQKLMSGELDVSDMDL
jgi:hsdS, type I site-specific deoxyribonuclease